MSLSSYLAPRGKRGIFQLRVPVPRALHGLGKPKERIKSLGTSDREIASKRALPILAGWQAEWASAMGERIFASTGMVTPSRAPTDPTTTAVRFGFDSMLAAMEERRREWPVDDAGYAARLAEREADLRRYTRRLQDGDLSQWEGPADRVIARDSLSIAKGSDEYAAFVRAIAEATVEAIAVFMRRASGELDAAPRAAVVQKAKAKEAAKAKPGETILELFEMYAAELLQAKKKRPAGVDQDRMVVQQFAEFVGNDIAVATIGYELAKEFVDALAKMPAGYKKRRDYDGLTVRQAIEKGQRESAKVISPITQQRYISTLSPLFSWLQGDRGGRRVGSNPFDGLHLDTGKLKKANARPPFTAKQIATIVNSPLFTGFQADGKEHLPGDVRADDWRFWLPLCCLFSGARIGEVAQLHVDDVFKAESIWCVELRSDEETDQRTKNDKSRIVALHSTLLKMGFLAFVQRQRERADQDGDRQLFPELDSGPRRQYGDEPSKWWRRYLDRIGVKSRNGRDGFGAHSFRHTMADQLRAAGHLDDIFGPLILGHYKGGVTAGYGAARQGTPRLSREMIESALFIPIEKGRVVEGGKPVDFSHLFGAENVK